MDGKPFTLVAYNSWQLIERGLSDEDLDYFFASLTAMGFTSFNAATNGIERTKPQIMQSLIRVCNIGRAHGLLPLIGTGLHHYENGKAVRHVPRGQEAEAGRAFARTLLAFDGPYAVVVNGLDDYIDGDSVNAMAGGIREVVGAPLTYHPRHGTFAIPSVNNSFSYTQSGHKDLSAGFAASLVKACPTDRPCYAGEGPFEGMEDYAPGQHIITANDVRNAARGAVGAGAAGLGFAHNEVWPAAGNWKKYIRSAGAGATVEEAARIE
jgi:hypothetical protein